jgi:hypothetical protein
MTADEMWQTHVSDELKYLRECLDELRNKQSVPLNCAVHRERLDGLAKTMNSHCKDIDTLKGLRWQIIGALIVLQGLWVLASKFL